MFQMREMVIEKRIVIKFFLGFFGGFDNKFLMDYMDVNFRFSIILCWSNVIQCSFIGLGFCQSMGGSSSGGILYVRTVEYGYGFKMDFGLGLGGYEKVFLIGVFMVKNS